MSRTRDVLKVPRDRHTTAPRVLIKRCRGVDCVLNSRRELLIWRWQESRLHPTCNTQSKHHIAIKRRKSSQHYKLHGTLVSMFFFCSVTFAAKLFSILTPSAEEEERRKTIRNSFVLRSVFVTHFFKSQTNIPQPSVFV